MHKNYWLYLFLCPSFLCIIYFSWHDTHFIFSKDVNVHNVPHTEESEKRDREVRETEKVAGKERVVRGTEKRVISRF